MMKYELFRERLKKLRDKKEDSKSSLPPFPDSPRPLNVLKKTETTKTKLENIQEDDKKQPYKGIIDSIYRLFEWK
jgi:hypothetical protein